MCWEEKVNSSWFHNLYTAVFVSMWLVGRQMAFESLWFNVVAAIASEALCPHRVLVTVISVSIDSIAN